jgi:hypothetical protein
LQKDHRLTEGGFFRPKANQPMADNGREINNMAMERPEVYDLVPGDQVSGYVMSHIGDYKTNGIDRLSLVVESMDPDPVHLLVVNTFNRDVPTRRYRFPVSALIEGHMGLIHFGDPDPENTIDKTGEIDRIVSRKIS